MKKELVIIALLMAGGVISGCRRIDNTGVGDFGPIEPAAQPLPGCGIDSKELRAAADKMARSIMGTHQIVGEGVGPRIVVDSAYFTNDSAQPIDKAMFTDYLRVDLQRSSQGRFEILGRHYTDMVEDERAAEREGAVTGGAVVSPSTRLGWDYRLGGAIRSLWKVVPATGQESAYFMITFELIERGSSRVVWSDRYEFKKVANVSVIYR
jgi:penicillin-binding protein activator